MKKANILALAFVIVLCLTLTSCVRNNVGIVLNDSEGGNITYTYKVNKTVIDRYLSGKPPERLANAATEQIGTETYYVATVNVTAPTDAELEAQLLDLTLLEESGAEIFSEATVSENYIKLVTSSDIIPEDIKTLAVAEGVNIYEHVKLELTVICPREIDAYAGGELSPDGRTVTLTLNDISQAQSLEILYKKAPPSSSLILAISIIAIVVAFAIAIGITLYVRYRKRKAAEAMPDKPIDQI